MAFEGRPNGRYWWTIGTTPLEPWVVYGGRLKRLCFLYVRYVGEQYGKPNAARVCVC